MSSLGTRSSRSKRPPDSQASGTAWLTIQDLAKTYGKQRALSGFEVDLAKGEVLSIVGPSGAGKSTILKLLLGLEEPDTGAIHLNGRDLLELPIQERNIGVVFQQYALFPHMSALENVSFPMEARQAQTFLGYLRSASSPTLRRERRRRAEELLEVVGLSAYADKKPAQMSGGEQQRVALARALVLEPDLLVLDEPLAALDSSLRADLQDQILRIQKAFGVTTIYVTHDQAEALAIADRIAVLSRGELQQIGPPAEVFFRPRTEFVARFLGAKNLFEVEGVDQPEVGLCRVRCKGGAELRIPPPAPRPGWRIGMRPETLEIAVGTPSSPFQLSGWIRELSFRGSLWSYEIELKTGTRLAVSAVASSSGALAVGSEITVLYSPDSLFILES